MHAALALSMYRPTQEFLNRGQVPVRIHATSAKPLKSVDSQIEKKASPKPSEKAVPSHKNARAQSEPATISSPTNEQTAQAHEADTSKTAGSADGSIDGGSRAHDASLVRSSFRQPEYTHDALAAGYETDVIAEILVNKDGSVSDVKLGKPLLYDMEHRLIQSIRQARFIAAKNQQGDEVQSWTRIRFRLIIPR